MVLPLAKSPRGYLRLSYVGAVDVEGDGVTQSWDLTEFPEYIRADPAFKGCLVIFAKAASSISIDDSVISFVPSTGTPEELVLTLNAADEDAEISLDVWCLHSIVGGVIDGPRLYLAGGAGNETRQFAGAVRVAGQTVLDDDTPGQIAFQVPIPTGLNRAFAITALIVGRFEDGNATCQEFYFSGHRDSNGDLQFGPSDVNQTLRSGSGDNVPKLDGADSDADSVWLTFVTDDDGPVCVDWEYSISPPLLDTFPPAPPVP